MNSIMKNIIKSLISPIISVQQRNGQHIITTNVAIKWEFRVCQRKRVIMSYKQQKESDTLFSVQLNVHIKKSNRQSSPNSDIIKENKKWTTTIAYSIQSCQLVCSATSIVLPLAPVTTAYAWHRFQGPPSRSLKKVWPPHRPPCC